MAKSLICNFGTIGCIDNTTTYFPIAGAIQPTTDFTPTEAQAQIPIKTAGTFREMRFFVPTNTASVTSVVTLRKNGAGTALTANVTSDATGWFAIVADVACASGDKFAIEVVVPAEAGTNTLTITSTLLVYEPTDSGKTIQIFACSGDNPTLSTDSVSRFMSACGEPVFSTIEANNKFRIRTSCSLEGLYACAVSNARTTDTIVQVRKNGGDGSASVTFGSGVSGQLTPSASTDSFVAGDDFNFSVTTSTGGGGIVLCVLSVEVVSTNGTWPMCCAYSAGQSIGPATTQYMGPHGALQEATATENNAEIQAPFGFTIQEGHVLVTANTNATSAATVTARDDNVDSILVITIPTATTGLLSQNLVVDITTGQTLSWEFDNPDPSGSVTRNWIGMLATTPSVTSSAPVFYNIYRQMRG